MLKFVDDSKLLKEVSDIGDVIRLQDDLDQIYGWASTNQMRWTSESWDWRHKDRIKHIHTRPI